MIITFTNIISQFIFKLPSKVHNPRRPVIILIHTGAFYSGAGTSVVGGPHYVTDQNIVLVTFNYRLASLGKRFQKIFLYQ